MMITEYYPTLLEMAPWNKQYPVTRLDGWNIFCGPKIGELAPDESVVVKSNEPRQSLHTLLDSSFSSRQNQKFFILFFDGINHGNTTNDTKNLADALESKYNTLIDVLVVTNYYDTNSYDAVSNIVGDMDGKCAQKYGASWQSIYVLDSEKKVVRKSCGLMKEELERFLDMSS